MSHASLILFQPSMGNSNAAHLICFVGLPLDRIVVMAPYNSSADLRNRLMGCNFALADRIESKIKINIPDEGGNHGQASYKLSPIGCCCEAVSSRAPGSCTEFVVCESIQDADWMLGPVMVWNVSGNVIQNKEWKTYLYCNSSKGGNDIEGTAQYAVVRERGVILPDSICCFHSRYLGYLCHKRSVCKVDDMGQASGKIIRTQGNFRWEVLYTYGSWFS